MSKRPLGPSRRINHNLKSEIRPKTYTFDILPAKNEALPKISADFEKGHSSLRNLDSSSESSSTDDSLKVLQTAANENFDKILTLKFELQESRNEVIRLRERLADRDLEVKILTKRLSFKKDFSNGFEDNLKETPTPKSCKKCCEKDSLVSDLYQKLRTLETAVEAFCLTDPNSSPKSANSFISEKDLCTILQNVNDLNQIISENQRDISFSETGAMFQKPVVLDITFFKNGFQLQSDGKFRSFNDESSQGFLRDLLDGFFPAEMQAEYPDGVFFLVNDRRFEIYVDQLGYRSSFAGIGRKLISRPSSAIKSEKVLPNLVQNSTDSRSTGSKSEISTSKPSTSSSRKSSIDMKKYSPFLKNYMGNDVCKLKVFGLENEPFLLELVSYDTVKTLKGLILNILKTRQSGCKDFALFTDFPKRAIVDDSMTISDLNLAPNGIVHVCKAINYEKKI